ncbi:MAG: SHOCT domain-containing protein [Chloroflexales bacterium]|nr:SHOCT domain-containing protein [Chloroflexales bacterium]
MRRGARGGTPSRSGPGLLRTAGRTAVVAGTATAVSKGVSGAMDSAAEQRAAAEQQRAAAEQQRFESAVQQAVAQQLAAAPPAAAPPAPAGGADRIAQLQQLAELKRMGILTDAEFEAEKARILGS